MGKYYVTEVQVPQLTAGPTAFSNADILFDWIAFEIPKGTACLKSIQLVMPGTNGADANAHDIELFFAKSINGVAPATVGTQNAAVSSAGATARYRRNIIGFKHLDCSTRSDDEDLLGFNVWGSGLTTIAHDAASTYNTQSTELILQGDLAYGSTEGYQTIFVAGIAKGAFDFGTGVALNNSPVNQAATTVETTLTTSGTDAQACFQIGDEVVAQDGAKIGSVTAIPGSTSIKVDAVEEALTNADEICLKYPITFHFGFEY